MKGLPTAADIRNAALRIQGHIHHTPLLSNHTINKISGASIYFKCENFQKAGAFKSRGACNAVFSLSDEDFKRGVATHSSGNHAAALARAAVLRGGKAFIVMPENSAAVKIAAVKHYGGIIHFCKPTLEARETTLAQVMKDTGSIEIHPYNDYRIISGQATAAMEILDAMPGPKVIMAPVGGGGLLSGTALSGHYFNPDSKIVAAEPEGADDAYRSFYEGRFIPSKNPNTIADGLLTSLGSLTYPIITKYVDGIIRVSEDSIKEAMRLVWERMKIIIEPSSAVPLAAVLDHPQEFRGKSVAIILSGGNVDLEKLPWKS